MLFYFAFTLFASATLLFLVQPMVGKMVLPKLGGTPAVWNTCMVFFQTVLLVGYTYTHTVSTWRDRRGQLLAQFVILALPFVVLPYSLGTWNPPADYNPIISVLWLLLGMVGLPFFVVATSAPLLQKWFAATGHPASKDPYFLYGASNFGSMLALLIYPILVEPFFSVETQAWLWTVGYGMLVVLVVGCGLIIWRVPASAALEVLSPAQADRETGGLRDKETGGPAAETKTAITAARRSGRQRPLLYAGALGPRTAPSVVDVPARPPSLGRRLRWVGLAAAPSSLMLGVTTYLTTDIAAIPLFLVVPLALYLLTFILVFARWPVPWTQGPHTVLLYVQPCFLMFLVLILFAHLNLPTWLEFFIHLAAFFTTALVCHGELAKDRPPARYLTEFYLCMSIGGVLGGMFNALVAPPLFWFGVIEYYLAMVLACFLRPALIGPSPFIPGDTSDHRVTNLGRVLDIAAPLLLGLIAFVLVKFGVDFGYRSYALAAAVVLVLALAGRPVRFGLALGLLIAAVSCMERRNDSYLEGGGRRTTVFEGRSFFSFVKVTRDEFPHRSFHTLIHGGINHGQQHLDESRRRETITYFHPTGGIGQIFEKFKWPDARLPASLVGLGAAPTGHLPGSLYVGMMSEPPYAVVGLGIGTLAAHARPWQHVVFYEIDPLILRLSEPTEDEDPYFFYLQDAKQRGAKLEVILGDGRLTLQKDPYVHKFPSRKFENYYHILVLDAFSSDAIPVHLLTAEAVDLYLSKLAPGGVLIFNTTNRYVDIRPVLADLAQAKGLAYLSFGDYSEGIPDKFGSDWVVLQRKDFAKKGQAVNGGPPLHERLDTKRWEAPNKGFRGPIWTDSYSNLLRVMNW